MITMSLVSRTQHEAIIRNCMVPMRDEVRLATDIFFPGTTGPWPVLLERTPYDKTAARLNEFTVDHPEVFGREELVRFFTDAGFVVVFQDCRGRYGSEGSFVKYRNEAEDGFDTIAWIADQPWCNGQVGSMGLSYSAHTQMAAACLNPPALAAMICDCGGFSNAYQGGIRFGGALELKQVTWAYRHALRSVAASSRPEIKAALESYDLAEWVQRMPWQRGKSPLSPIPEYENFLFEQWEHGVFDEYWKVPALYAKGWYEHMCPLPSVHLSGWYDPYAVTAVENFKGLSQLGHKVNLILGPWTHGNRSISYSGNVEMGDQATFEAAIGMDYVQFRICYFLHHFAQHKSPLSSQVLYFVMGGGSGQKDMQSRMSHGGQWHTSESWPPAESKPIPLYLGPGGSLLAQPSPELAAYSYQFDPINPVPTMGGPITSGAPLMFGGAFDQKETADTFGTKAVGMALSNRQDVLIFETDLLTEVVTIAGDVAVTLFITSDRPTTDFTAKLVDVYPTSADYPAGYAMNLCDGILRACYRDGFDQARSLVPSEITELKIQLYPTANCFEVGHRIRLEISSSNFPRFDVNPNYAAGEDLSVVKFTATNTIMTGAKYPSRIETSLLKQ